MSCNSYVYSIAAKPSCVHPPLPGVHYLFRWCTHLYILYMYLCIPTAGFQSFPRAAYLSLIHSLSHQPLSSPHHSPPVAPSPPSRGRPPSSSPLHRSPPTQGETGAGGGGEDEPDITGAPPSLAVCGICRGSLAYSVLLWASAHHS